MSTIYMMMIVIATVASQRNNILYLWFNGHRDGEYCTFTINVVNITGVDLMTCAKQCEIHPECASFFYRESGGICHGCLKYFSIVSPGLPRLQDSKYFVETSSWWYFSNSRYIAILAEGPFNAVEDICVSHAGHLVNIGSAEENEFVLSLMRNHTDTTRRVIRDMRSVRIGLNDIRTEGEYRWVGDSTSPGYFNWRPSGEPNAQRLDYDCTYMSNDGLWSTTTCSGQDPFICEVN